MERLRNWVLALSTFCIAAPTLAPGADGASDEPVEAPSAYVAPQEEEPPSPERIAELIAALDSPVFTEREQASRELSRAGRVAVEPLAAVAERGSLEAATRAMDAIHAIYNRGDDATLDAVEEALEKLGESSNPSVASRALTVLELNSGIRQRRAVAELKRLGAKFKYTVDVRGRHELQHVLFGRNWKGGDDALKYLQRLPHVPAIYVVRSQKISPMSEEAQKELAATLPQSNVQERGAACLGVAGGNHPQGTQIMKVETGSAADNGGIREWDIITSIGGEPAPSFDELVRLIATHEPGEAVDIDVVRGGQELTLEVEMGDWESLPSQDPPVVEKQRRTPAPDPPILPIPEPSPDP